MTKMRIAKEDCPQVKLECLRMLATLQLDPARTEFLSQFIYTYLKLNQDEEQIFQAGIDRLETVEQEVIMETITSWEKRGQLKGKVNLVIRLLHRKLGQLPPSLETMIQSLEIEEIEALGEALLDFNDVDDLSTWLQRQETT